jgi:hypothetical protein
MQFAFLGYPESGGRWLLVTDRLPEQILNDIIGALDAKMLPDLQYALKLATASGSKVTAPCYQAWISIITIRQTAVQDDQGQPLPKRGQERGVVRIDQGPKLVEHARDLRQLLRVRGATGGHRYPDRRRRRVLRLPSRNRDHHRRGFHVGRHGAFSFERRYFRRVVAFRQIRQRLAPL